MDFSIQANRATLDYGTKAEITAIGCSGNINWQNIPYNYSETGKAISFYPQASQTYRAICSTSDCLAKTTITVNCHVSLVTELYNNSNLITEQKFKASASCSNGSLEITITDDPRRWQHQDNTETKICESGAGELVYKNRPIRATKAKATCMDASGAVLCEKEVEYPSTKSKCEEFKIIPTAQENGTIKLSTQGCSNVIYLKEQGVLYNPSVPRELTVNSPNVPIVYEANCSNGCKTTYELKPKDIKLRLSPTNYGWTSSDKNYDYQKGFDSIEATCPNGSSIEWQMPTTDFEVTDSESCNGISGECIASKVTTKSGNFSPDGVYTAKCKTEDGQTKSITIRFTQKSATCLQILNAPKSVSLGQKVSLEVKYCNGNIIWTKALYDPKAVGYYGTPQQFSTGYTAVDVPQNTTKYTVSCDGLPQCSESVVVELKPCNLQNELTFNGKKIDFTDVVKIGAEINATIKGCEGGKLVWKYDNQFIEGNPVVLKPYGSNGSNFTIYNVECLVNGSKLCSTSFSLIVDKTPPAQLNCPELKLSSRPSSITRCTPQSVEITGNGCSNGSQYTWKINGTTTTTQSNIFTTNIDKETTIEATCKDIYGNSSDASIKVTANEPEITVSPLQVYEGLPQTIYVDGCYNQNNCNKDGNIKWFLNGTLVSSSNYINVNIHKPTTYEVICNDGKPVPIQIALKPSQNCPQTIVVEEPSSDKTTLVATACDVNYEIFWYKEVPLNGATICNAKSYEWKLWSVNKRKITINRPIDCPNINDPWVNPIDRYKLICVVNGSLCTTKLPVISPKAYQQSQIPPVTPDTGVESTTPDPCNKYKWFDKSRVSANQPWLLYSAWCENGIVNWYSDEARTQLVTTLTAPAEYTVTNKKITKYYASCNDCKDAGGADFKVSGNRIITENTDSEPSGTNRIAANSTAAATPCTFGTPQVIQGVLQTALCQSIELMKLNGQLDRDKIALVLADLETSMKAQYAQNGITIVFPTDKTAIIQQIIDSQGDCGSLATPAGGLAAGTQGTLPPNFNPASGYPAIINSVIPKLPSITASVTPASCGLTNGVVKLTAKDGTPPYQYSKDGTTFQSTDTFEALAVGKYIFHVKDSKGEKGSLVMEVKSEDNNVERSIYEPIIGIANARTDGTPITVRWDATTTPYTFTPKEGITLTRIAGTGKFQLSTTNPEDKQWEGTYGVYFKKNDHNTFVGFYNETMSGICTPSGYTLNCNPMCQERFLPPNRYDQYACKQYDDIQIYGNCEILHTTLTELGGTTDATAEAFDYKDAHLVPAKCKDGTIIGYHIFYFNFRSDKPVLQIGKDKLDEFKNNYDIYRTAGNSYYYLGEPSEGRKKWVAAMYTGSWSMMWDGVKDEWQSCVNDPECLASIILSTVQGALSVIPIKNFRVIGTPDYPHELRQAEALGGLTRATEIEFFGGSSKGIEGVIRTVDNEVIPMSLKEFTGDVKSNFRKIRDNGNKIRTSGDPNVIIGSNPNTYLYAEVSYTYQELKTFIESSASNVLPQKDVFKQVIIKTSDGKFALVPTN